MAGTKSITFIFVTPIIFKPSANISILPTQVISDDMDSHDITRKALESPKFANGEDYAVQQGAGMVVVKSTEERERAAVTFLKWLTAPNSDAAEYKAYGNSVAVPCVFFVLAGIVWAQNEEVKS